MWDKVIIVRRISMNYIFIDSNEIIGGIEALFLDVCCKIKLPKVAKGIPHFCNTKFPIIAKGH